MTHERFMTPASLALCLVFGCTSLNESTMRPVKRVDAGADAALDAAALDAAPVDAGAATSPEAGGLDAGADRDARPSDQPGADAGARDAATDGGSPDTGPPPEPPAVPCPPGDRMTRGAGTRDTGGDTSPPTYVLCGRIVAAHGESSTAAGWRLRGELAPSTTDAVLRAGGFALRAR